MNDKYMLISVCDREILTEKFETLELAQAEADAKLITAQAEAEANALLEKSLTSQILQEKYIEKWNGQLPNVIAGDDGTSILVQPTP